MTKMILLVLVASSIIAAVAPAVAKPDKATTPAQFSNARVYLPRATPVAAPA